MTISAKVLADSVSYYTGVRLCTLELFYPRIIHAEFMTHRVFSRNSSSSRAIPFLTMLKAILKDPYVPSKWGLNKKGMQASEEEANPFWCRVIWFAAMYAALGLAWLLNKIGVHKQHVNRLTEPFGHIKVVVTATEWENFFSLRIHPDAQPEIQELATRIKEAMDASTPVVRDASNPWHLPYTDDMVPARAGGGLLDLIKVCVARCARTSYRLHDGSYPPIEKDIALADDLTVKRHMSPLEHACKVCKTGKWNFNLRGWASYRYFTEVGILEDALF